MNLNYKLVVEFLGEKKEYVVDFGSAKLTDGITLENINESELTKVLTNYVSDYVTTNVVTQSIDIDDTKVTFKMSYKENPNLCMSEEFPVYFGGRALTNDEVINMFSKHFVNWSNKHMKVYATQI